MTDIFVVIYLNDNPHLLKLSGRAPGFTSDASWIAFAKYDLHSKPEKCLFHMQKIEFLGLMVTPTGISMDMAKTDVVSIWPTPTNLKAVQAFLGFANFLSPIHCGFSDIVIPLIHLTRKEPRSPWGPDHTKVFETSRQPLHQAPILAHFNPE